VAECQALHFLAVPCTRQQKFWRQGVVLVQTKILQLRSRTAALAVTTVGRSDTASAHSIADCHHVRESKATARKIAVLFYNTLRHGMNYPRADHYELQYRNRVLATFSGEPRRWT
jgi:transposase